MSEFERDGEKIPYATVEVALADEWKALSEIGYEDNASRMNWSVRGFDGSDLSSVVGKVLTVSDYDTWTFKKEFVTNYGRKESRIVGLKIQFPWRNCLLYNFLNYTTSQRGWRSKKAQRGLAPPSIFLNCQTPWLVLYFQKVNASRNRPLWGIGGELPFFRVRGLALPLIIQRFISAFEKEQDINVLDKPSSGARSGPSPASYQKKA